MVLSVLISIRLSEMKIVYYFGIDWIKNPVFLKEYSITLGLVSILICYMGIKGLNILWKRIK